MKSWVVAAGLIEDPTGVLLVCNRRRDGSLDWSPPGGVIEADIGESLVEGLTREVWEETGLSVHSWTGPVYDVEVVAADLGWTLRAGVFVARSFTGKLEVADPDGIVVDARFVPVSEWGMYLSSTRVWVREPIEGWIARVPLTEWRYRLEGSEVVRLHATD